MIAMSTMPESSYDANVADAAPDPVAALGEPTAEFRAGGQRLAWQMAAVPLCFVGGIICVGIPVAALLWGHLRGAHFGKLITLGCALIGGSVVLAIRAYKHRRLRVLVYPEGLVRMDGDEANAFFWEDIDTVFRKNNSDSAWEALAHGGLLYTLHLASGKQTTFEDHLNDLKTLGKIIEAGTLPYLLPHYQATLDDGAVVEFGALAFDAQGIRGEKVHLPWNDVQSLAMTEKAITIKKKKKWTAWKTIPTDDVANPHVVAELLKPILDSRLTTFYDAKR